MTARARRRLNDARTCYVCRLPIPAAHGVYHTALGILVHQGVCAAKVVRASRDHDRSARGRNVPRGEVLRRLETGRDETPRHATSGGEKERATGGSGSRLYLSYGARAGESYR
jgi:hypothetical protein